MGHLHHRAQRRTLHRRELRLRGGLGWLQRQDNRRQDGEPAQ
jgi:hypothetical protein